jgi:hypothetical protein
METLLIILVLALIYCFYQLARNKKVYDIRMDWIKENDPRWDKYTYDYMFKPSFRNWFGLKFPIKSDF